MVYTEHCEGKRQNVHQDSRIMAIILIKSKFIAMEHFEDLRLLNFVTYLLLQLNQYDSATAIKSL